MWLDAKAVAAQELALSGHVYVFAQARTSENRYPKLLVEVLNLNGDRAGELYLYAVDLLTNTVQPVPSTLAWFAQFDKKAEGC